MAEPTNTRKVLRRALAREMDLAFPRLVGADFSTITSTGSPSQLIDSALLQPASYWNRASIIIASGAQAGQIRMIDTHAAGGILNLVSALPAEPAAGSEYELHTVWNTADLHDAINRAIEDGFPDFYDAIIDETQIVQEDKLSYDLSGLAKAPYFIGEVWIERGKSVARGKATGGSATTLQDTAQNWTVNAEANKRVSIYDGTGANQSAIVTSNTATQLTFGSITTAPANGSKYALWDPADEDEDWYRVPAARILPRSWPTNLYLAHDYSDFYGMRIRLHYIPGPTVLSSDSDTTVVPKEFILNRAAAILHQKKMSNSRADRSRHGDLANRYLQIAEAYRKSRAFPMPAAALWLEREASHPWSTLSNDPMGWRS